MRPVPGTAVALRVHTSVVLLIAAVLAAAAPASAGDRYDLDTGREIALLGAGAGLGAGAIWSAYTLEPLDELELRGLDPAALPWFDRFATRQWSPAAETASDVLMIGSAAAPLLLLTQAGAAASEADIALMYGQTLLIEQGLIGILKTTFRRPRPFTYNPDPRIDDALRRSGHAVRSFPSGHAANAFAAAVFAGEVYARLHPDDPARHWVRSGGLVVATATAYLRVRAGRHFPSDVVAGAVIGSLIGWAVPRLHEVDRAADGAAGAGPGLVVGFAF